MGFWQVIGSGWRDALAALRQDNSLLPATLLAMLAITALTSSTLPQWHQVTQASTDLNQAKPFDILNSLTDVARGLLYAIAATPIMLAVHRFVLLGENEKTFNNRRRILRFAIWLVAYRLIPTLMSTFGDEIGRLHPVIGGLVNFSLGVAYLYVTPRLVMSFPAIALDVDHPIRDSWHRTLGHWWYVAGVMLFGSLPLLVFSIGSLFSDYVFIWIVALALLNTLWPVLGAALASTLYKNFSGHDARQPQLQL
jgi:hypothetical protein